MIIRYFVILGFLVLLYSCQSLEFIYKDNKNITNPLYEKTKVEIAGAELPLIFSYSSRYFGKNKNNDYLLKIFISETKTNRSVGDNQAVSKLDYMLKFDYYLENINKNCSVLEKTTYSRFTYLPKSSGYNYGSDQSLDKLYELAGSDNLSQFIMSVSGMDLVDCINED